VARIPPCAQSASVAGARPSTSWSASTTARCRVRSCALAFRAVDVQQRRRWTRRGDGQRRRRRGGRRAGTGVSGVPAGCNVCIDVQVHVRPSLAQTASESREESIRREREARRGRARHRRPRPARRRTVSAAAGLSRRGTPPGRPPRADGASCVADARRVAHRGACLRSLAVWRMHVRDVSRTDRATDHGRRLRPRHEEAALPARTALPVNLHLPGVHVARLEREPVLEGDR
jgi:hypothetical protein